jgi:hypothetical protein
MRRRFDDAYQRRDLSPKKSRPITHRGVSLPQGGEVKISEVPTWKLKLTWLLFLPFEFIYLLGEVGSECDRELDRREKERSLQAMQETKAAK